MVIIIAIGIVAYKLDRQGKLAVQTRKSSSPSKIEVILVADLSEANEKGDNCVKIIHLVRAVGARGIITQEFAPESNSPLIKQYHVLTVPTVLVLDDGRVVSRYEGESSSTVQEIQTAFAALSGARP